MIERTLEFATNPKNKLLAKYGDGQGIRKIERMIQPTSNIGLGHACNLSFKRALPNLNRGNGNTPQKQINNFGQGRGFSHPQSSLQGSIKGCGAYNNNQGKRFGNNSPRNFNSPSTEGPTTRVPSQTSPNAMESRFHNPTLVVDGSSGGSSNSTITSLISSKSINWESQHFSPQFRYIRTLLQLM